jgi:hypothetical protein
MTDRTKALDELIAGDADLYDVPKFPDHIGETVPAGVIEQFARDLESGDFANVSYALNARMCCNGYHCGCRGSTVGEYLAHELLTASARITGDKGGELHRRAPPLQACKKCGFLPNSSD